MSNKFRKSFTLIELLVVLALVAILSVVVILTLNPAELIKQARDSNRLSDLSTINTALNLFSADVTSGFMGTSTIVYVSLPDNASSTCGSWGLPTLPSGYTYNCVTNANLRNTNGTGWIPVNFQRISSNSPISQLPIDPINTTSTRLYYAYIAGGSWELNATIEASKNKLGGSGDLVSKDGGSNPSTYEMGNNLDLNPIEQGDTSLVGYWKLDETAGSTAYDSSGNGKDGTYSNNPTLGQPSRSAKTLGYSATFSGAADSRMTVPAIGYLPMTITVYHKRDDSSASGSYRDLFSASANVHYLITDPVNRNVGSWNSGDRFTSYIEPNDGIWHQYVLVLNSLSSQDFYIDGLLIGNINSGIDPTINPIIYVGNWTSGYAVGPMDEVRIYNRALSAAEILAIYNSTK